MRRQLPGWSPLPLSAVFGAAGGALGLSGETGLERRIAETWGMDDALLADSGTGALTLALRAARGDDARPVAMPAWACFDLATAADGAGSPVVLYDLDPTTLAPEPDSLRAALAAGVSAIVLVHFFGIPLDVAALRRELPPGAVVIEDAAQGAGARWNGRRLGGLGDLSVLSFGRGKGLTAGRGGALLATAGARPLLERARTMLGAAGSGSKEVVTLAAQWMLGSPSVYALPASLPFLRLGETVYHSPSPVRGMSRAARAAVLRTLPLADNEAAQRRTRANRLIAAAGPGLAAVRVPDGAEAGYLRLPMMATRDMRAAALSAETRAHGVMPGYPVALCDLAGFRERCINVGAGFPGARRLAELLVTLPTHGLVNEDDMAWLSRWVAQGKAA